MMDDPTKIEIDFDPQQQRMVGVATHGMTPFDVPFISEITARLWQGGCRDGLILPNFIDVVISLYPWERYTINNNAERIEVRMYDSEDQAFDQVDSIARTVNKYRDNGKNVLVHCQAGLNRSSLIVAKALILDGRSPKDSIDLIREKRSPACLCNKAFEEWLLKGSKPKG
jgi:protein-tyrosine phosphatase